MQQLFNQLAVRLQTKFPGEFEILKSFGFDDLCSKESKIWLRIFHYRQDDPNIKYVKMRIFYVPHAHWKADVLFQDVPNNWNIDDLEAAVLSKTLHRQLTIFDFPHDSVS